MADATKEPIVTGCTCDFSGGTRGMDRCHRCAGTGSRFLASTNGNAFYFPNTRNGYEDACRTLVIEPEAEPQPVSDPYKLDGEQAPSNLQKMQIGPGKEE